MLPNDYSGGGFFTSLAMLPLLIFAVVMIMIGLIVYDSGDKGTGGFIAVVGLGCAAYAGLISWKSFKQNK